MDRRSGVTRAGGFVYADGHLVFRFKEEERWQIAAVVQDHAQHALIEAFESY